MRSASSNDSLPECRSASRSMDCSMIHLDIESSCYLGALGVLAVWSLSNSRFLLLVLQLVEPAVIAVAGHKFFVGAVFDYLAFVQDDDAVYVLDGGEAVGDDDAGAAPHQLDEGVLYEDLGFRIDRGGSLVHHEEDRGVEGDGAREGDELALAYREIAAALAYRVL